MLGSSVASVFDSIARLRHFRVHKSEFAKIDTYAHKGADGITEAAGLVRSMAGHHRMPDALRRVDTLARNGLPVNGLTDLSGET
jgi:hypothetical protein